MYDEFHPIPISNASRLRNQMRSLGVWWLEFNTFTALAWVPSLFRETEILQAAQLGKKNPEKPKQQERWQGRVYFWKVEKLGQR